PSKPPARPPPAPHKEEGAEVAWPFSIAHTRNGNRVSKGSMQLIGRNGRHGHREHVDTFFDQFASFCCTGLAADGTLRSLLVENRTRLFRETLAHVFAVAQDVVDDFLAHLL